MFHSSIHTLKLIPTPFPTPPPPPDKMADILADDIFGCIFLNENDRIPIQIVLKFVPKSPISDTPVLV